MQNSNDPITRPDKMQFLEMARTAESSQDPIDLYNPDCCSHYNWGTFPDFKKAAACYEKPVVAGIGGAENNLGLLYLTGQGVEQDTLKAMTLFKKASDKGGIDAMNSPDAVVEPASGTAFQAGFFSPAGASVRAGLCGFH